MPRLIIAAYAFTNSIGYAGNKSGWDKILIIVTCENTISGQDYSPVRFVQKRKEYESCFNSFMLFVLFILFNCSWTSL